MSGAVTTRGPRQSDGDDGASEGAEEDGASLPLKVEEQTRLRPRPAHVGPGAVYSRDMGRCNSKGGGAAPGQAAARGPLWLPRWRWRWLWWVGGAAESAPLSRARRARGEGVRARGAGARQLIQLSRANI